MKCWIGKQLQPLTDIGVGGGGEAAQTEAQQVQSLELVEIEHFQIFF